MSDTPHVRYSVEGRIAHIELDRPERLNAISLRMPGDLRAAVERANEDDGVHVILLSGAGRSFCAGYDLKEFAEAGGTEWTQPMPWDPMRDFRGMRRFTDDYMSLWRSYKPTVARVHGHAIAGGSDIALCCDFLLMAEDATIGYPPARVWGCPTTAMWVFRLGLQRAREMLYTGRVLSGTEARDWGLALDATPADDLDARVQELTDRLVGVPRNQLMMQKLLVNQTYEGLGVSNAQSLATLFDGITRHSPEGIWFKRYAETHGFHAAVAWRDSGRPIPQGEEARRAAARLGGDGDGDGDGDGQ